MRGPETTPTHPVAPPPRSSTTRLREPGSLAPAQPVCGIGPQPSRARQTLRRQSGTSTRRRSRPRATQSLLHVTDHERAKQEHRDESYATVMRRPRLPRWLRRLPTLAVALPGKRLWQIEIAGRGVVLDYPSGGRPIGFITLRIMAGRSQREAGTEALDRVRRVCEHEYGRSARGALDLELRSATWLPESFVLRSRAGRIFYRGGTDRPPGPPGRAKIGI